MILHLLSLGYFLYVLGFTLWMTVIFHHNLDVVLLGSHLFLFGFGLRIPLLIYIRIQLERAMKDKRDK